MIDRANRLSAQASVEADALFKAFGKPLTLKSLLPALALTAAGLLFNLFADQTSVPAQKLLDWDPLGIWIDVSYHLPNVFVIFLAMLAVWRMSPAKRGLLGLLLLGFAIGTPVSETIKQITGRARPDWSVSMTDANREWIETWRAKHPQTAITTEKRDQWVWLTADRPVKYEGYPWLISGYSSFPSGHARSAFVFAGFLSQLYPELRAMWYFFASGCAAARVQQQAHHPGDVLAGAALGMLICKLLFAWRWAFGVSARSVAWFERRLRAVMRT